MTRCLLRPLRGGIFSAQCQECRLEIKDYGLLKHLSRGAEFQVSSENQGLWLAETSRASGIFGAEHPAPRGSLGAEWQGCCLKNTRALRVE